MQMEVNVNANGVDSAGEVEEMGKLKLGRNDGRRKKNSKGRVPGFSRSYISS